MYTKSQLKNPPEVDEFFETVSYDKPGNPFSAAAAHDPDDDGPEKDEPSESKSASPTVRDRLLAAGYSDAEIVAKIATESPHPDSSL